MATLVFIPNTTKSAAVSQLTLEDIPQEVRENVEEVYETLKTNPGRIRVEFPSLGELNAYVAQVTAYCALRPGGAIRFRKSPTRKLPATTMDFRITDLQTENEETTAGINDAVENVKSAAKSK